MRRLRHTNVVWLAVLGTWLAPFLLTLGSIATSAAAEGNVLDAIESAPIVVVAEVENVTRLAHAGFQADLVVRRSLHRGQVVADSMTIAWEEPAPSLAPRFEAGRRVLVAAVPLPTASIWRLRVPDEVARRDLVGLAGDGAGYLLRPSMGELEVIEHFLAVDVDARLGDAGALYLARLCAVGGSRLAVAAARRLTDFHRLSDHLTPAAAHAIVDALVRPGMRELESALLEMLSTHRPPALQRPLEARIKARQGGIPSSLYAALGVIDGRLDDDVSERLLASQTPRDRETAVRHASGPRAQAMLRRLIRRDESAAVRAAAVHRLATLDGVDALPDLLRGLEDPAAAVRLASAKAAAGLGSEATAALHEMAMRDSSEAARAAVAALSMVGATARALLADLSTQHADAGMRTLATIAIGQPIGDRH